MAQRWKKFEVIVARYFGTLRNAFSGSNSGISASDSVHNYLYIENKLHSGTAIIKLMKETEIKASKENKIPILGLGDPDDVDKKAYIMCDIENLWPVIQHMDISVFDKRFPKGTSIYKLAQVADPNNKSLFELREKLQIQMKQIMRNKVISGNDLSNIESIAAMSYFISVLQDYIAPKES